MAEMSHRGNLDKAPFTITFHDEDSSWHDSSVLKALVNQTVLVRTKEGDIFDGEVTSLDEGTIALSNSVVGNSWTEMTLALTSITNIHYC